MKRLMHVLALSAGIGTAHAQQALESIVVTAQKRAQALEDVPISMTVLGDDDFDRTRAGTLAELQQLVPNLSISPLDGVITVTVRGIGGGGRNIGFDTRVGVYLDGIYIGQAQAAGLPLADIAQVEVLRGPQGHLFGRNSVAGAINMTTREPAERLDASLRAVAGDHKTLEGRASLSGPIAAAAWGRITVGLESRGGTTLNLYNGERLDDLERFTTRGQLSFRPDDRLKINVLADHSDIKQNTVIGEATSNLFGFPLTCVPPASGPCPRRTVNYNTTPYVNNTLSGTSMNVKYDAAGGAALTAIIGYRHTHQTRQNDTDWSPADLFRINYADDFKQASAELRLVSSTSGPLRYVAGAYLMNEDAGTDRSATVGRDTDTLVRHPAVPDPIAFGALLGLSAGAKVPVSGTVKTDAYALFGSADYDITADLMLNLGARYTEERKDLLFNLDGSKSGAVQIGTAVNYTDRRADHRMTPMLGVTYALNPAINAYAKYSTGFKSGGWNADFLTQPQINSGFAFGRESVGSEEIGLKGTALGKRVRYDAAVFRSTYRDFQVFQFVDLGGGATVLMLRNAARAESAGGEAGVRALVGEGLTLGGNVGRVNAVFRSFPRGGPGGADAAGARLPDSPKLTAAFTVSYEIAAPSLGGRLALYGEYSHRSEAVANVGDVDKLDARDVVNARATFSTDHSRLELSLWARNLFDNDYAVAKGRDFFGNTYVKRGDPRAFGVEARYQF